jgi:DNA (cytosine-5)-methyltransferase 3A
MSCGRIALERAGIPVTNYFASEIDKSAIDVSKDNYPDIKHLGDICNIHYSQLGIEVDLTKSQMRVINIPIDLLIGGSPCQDISNLNKESNGLDGEKSGLFYEFLRLKNECTPKYFLLENVVGNKIAINEITRLMGVEPILIDAAKVSGARRKRYFLDKHS